MIRKDRTIVNFTPRLRVTSAMSPSSIDPEEKGTKVLNIRTADRIAQEEEALVLHLLHLNKASINLI